jgi:predicted DNA-binding protein with PD1-like motif
VKWRQIAGDGETTYVLVFDKGDEAAGELLRFAKERGLAAARLSGIGAFRDCVLGYFDRERRDYDRIPVGEQAEVLSLLGDIALKEDGEPQVHAHAVVGLRDGSTRGGHLLEGHVWPTLEVLLVESPSHLRRRSDAETGLALIDVEGSR